LKNFSAAVEKTLKNMITARPQKRRSSAKQYFRKHLSKGDYHSEGQRIEGFWFGKGAARLELDLQAGVREEAFLRLCDNQHPLTGGQLTPRPRRKDRRIYYDFAVSAPKSVSIMAVTMGDSRLIAAHKEAQLEAMSELERFACTRMHEGGRMTDARTAEIVAAAFLHDASRALDPQLHSHFVVFNATWDAKENRWKALQTSKIFERMTLFTEIYRNGLAMRVQALGYRIRQAPNGFEIEGVPLEIIERFSKRGGVIRAEEAKARAKTGLPLNNDERAVLARRTRPKKNDAITPEEVIAYQRSQLSAGELDLLRRLMDPRSETASEGAGETAGAYKLGEREPEPYSVAPKITASAAIRYARDHLFERHSVVSDYVMLREALRYARGGVEWDELKSELDSCPGLISVDNLFTTEDALKAEQRMIELVNRGTGRFRPLNPSFNLQVALNPEQRRVVQMVLRTPDQVIGIRGRAGTGKTTLVRELVRAISERHPVVVLAPKSGAVEALREKGLTGAATVQRFLADEDFQRGARGKVVVVDEAGMLSTRDMMALLEYANLHQSRLILSGDTGQHTGIEAGDALRLLETRSALRTLGVKKIERQINQEYREAIAELADGNAGEALARLERIGAVQQIKDDERYHKLAEEYRESVTAGKSALIVIPTWREIGVATEAVRACLRKSGILSGREVDFTVNVPLKWTLAQKQDLRNYYPGLALMFYKRTRQFQPGDSAEVVRVGPNLMEVRKPDGKSVYMTKKQARCFDVAEKGQVAVCTGEQLLLLANRKSAGLFNGQIVTVKEVEADGRIVLDNGKVIPADFRSFTHGYCVTSYASQGRTVEDVYVAVDSKSGFAAHRKQLYVSASRGQKRIKIFTDDIDFLRQAVNQPGTRLSATELVESARLAERERLAEQERQKRRQTTKISA
jgi:conjugative relaxase-like TrwC/TraI family protein